MLTSAVRSLGNLTRLGSIRKNPAKGPEWKRGSYQGASAEGVVYWLLIENAEKVEGDTERLVLTSQGLCQPERILGTWDSSIVWGRLSWSGAVLWIAGRSGPARGPPDCELRTLAAAAKRCLSLMADQWSLRRHLKLQDQGGDRIGARIRGF